MGYYPTPPAIVSKIKSYIKADYLYAALDPCCGCGTALKQLTDGMPVKTYGVELDNDRCREARKKLHRVAKGAFEATRISDSAFSLLFLNPPYDYEETDEDKISERKEKTFLIRAVPKLKSGGILIYIIPQNRLTNDIARILAYKFENILIYRFDDSEYSAYHQVVIMGKKKKIAGLDPDTEKDLVKASRAGTSLREIDYSNNPVYSIPETEVNVPLFRSLVIDEEELFQQIKGSRLWDILQEKDYLTIDGGKPPLPLHIGHLCLMLSAGKLDGEVGQGDDLHLVKGNVIKTIEQDEEEDEEGNITFTEKEVIKINIRALAPTGEIVTLM